MEAKKICRHRLPIEGYSAYQANDQHELNEENAEMS
jgi:hypothetical protein